MPRKKGNGEGTIYSNGKYWVGQVTIGRDPETGKLKRKSIYGKTKREVQERMTAIMYELHKESYIEPSNMLMKDWAKYWLENFKKSNIADTTYDRYASLIDRHIIDPLGDIKLKDLSTFHIQLSLNSLHARGMSDSYISTVFTRLNSMLEKAVGTEIIKKNPCSEVVLPKTGKKRKIESLTREEQVKLVEYCSSAKNGRLFIFQLGTGMRIGETLGLTWDHIDFKNGQIIICQSAAEIRGHAHISDKTKTPASTRSIPMSDKIKTLLTEILNQQDKEKNKLNLVFPSSQYTLQLSSNVRTRFSQYCKDSNIRKINIHALRHTFATRAIEQDINVKVLSYILGHKDIKVTLNTYADVLSDFKNSSLAKIDIFL